MSPKTINVNFKKRFVWKTFYIVMLLKSDVMSDIQETRAVLSQPVFVFICFQNLKVVWYWDWTVIFRRTCLQAINNLYLLKTSVNNASSLSSISFANLKVVCRILFTENWILKSSYLSKCFHLCHHFSLDLAILKWLAYQCFRDVSDHIH